eukprot:g31216.t1
MQKINIHTVYTSFSSSFSSSSAPPPSSPSSSSSASSSSSSSSSSSPRPGQSVLYGDASEGEDIEEGVDRDNYDLTFGNWKPWKRQGENIFENI